MARRTHTTELGCIACKDLTDLGAGREGWLVDNRDLHCALDTHSIALSNKSLILILGWSDDPYSNSRVKIRPDLSPIEAEHISAVEWLVFDDLRVLVVGTSRGYLLIFALDGKLIHRQLVYPGKILKLRVRGTRRDLQHDVSGEKVCVVLPDVVARFDGYDILNMLQKWYQDTHAQFWDEHGEKSSSDELGNSFERVPYQLWNVNKYGSFADAAITGFMPPPLMEFESNHRYYCAVSIGDDAVVSAYRLSEDRSRSLFGAILSRVVPATFSTISSFSKLIWRSEPKTPEKKPEPKPQPFARASPLTCIKDPPRKGEKLTLSPSGTLAAITDSLGRILLLDTQALVVVRLWKGYRDANCLFMEMLVNKDPSMPSTSSAHRECDKSDYCLCLAIHAPKKGIVEVWQMRTGPRLLTIPCGKGSRILQPTYRFGSSMPMEASSSSCSPYVPLEVFLLNGDSGQLSVINRWLQ